MTDDEVVRLVAEVGHRLQARQEAITAALSATMKADIEDLGDDPHLTTLLHASVDGNVGTIFHILVNDIPLDHLHPTTAAVEYAVRLAQREMPSHALRRAYHVGQTDLLGLCFLEVQELDCPEDLRVRVLHRIVQVASGYIDWITQNVLQAYDREWERHVSASGNLVSAMVNRVLDRQPVGPVQFLAETGYDLDQHHVAAIVWLPEDANDSVMGLERFVQRISSLNHQAAHPIFVAVDNALAWAWFPRGRSAAPPDLTAARALADDVSGRIAFGLPQQGIDGFRASHQQAQAAYRLGVLSDRPNLVSYGDPGVAAVSMLGRDLDATRAWVGGVLGPLAAKTPTAARARETLRVFLATGGSHTESARLLNLHRNSVKYRIDRILEVRGGALGAERLDVELALQACFFMGDGALPD